MGHNIFPNNGKLSHEAQIPMQPVHDRSLYLIVHPLFYVILLSGNQGHTKSYSDVHFSPLPLYTLNPKPKDTLYELHLRFLQQIHRRGFLTREDVQDHTKLQGGHLCPPLMALGKANIDTGSYTAIYQNKKGSRGLDASGREDEHNPYNFSLNATLQLYMPRFSITGVIFLNPKPPQTLSVETEA